METFKKALTSNVEPIVLNVERKCGAPYIINRLHRKTSLGSFFSGCFVPKNLCGTFIFGFFYLEIPLQQIPGKLSIGVKHIESIIIWKKLEIFGQHYENFGQHYENNVDQNLQKTTIIQIMLTEIFLRFLSFILLYSPRFTFSITIGT